MRTYHKQGKSSQDDQLVYDDLSTIFAQTKNNCERTSNYMNHLKKTFSTEAALKNLETLIPKQNKKTQRRKL